MHYNNTIYVIRVLFVYFAELLTDRSHWLRVLYSTDVNLHFSAWHVFFSLLLWKGFYICQKYTFLYKNKQARPAQIRKRNAKVT